MKMLGYLLVFLVHQVASQCDTDNGWQELSGDCVRLSRSAPETQYTWQEAREACMLEGGDLASIHSVNEQAAIIQMAFDSQLIGFDLWHGMTQLPSKSGSFYWSDGSQIDFLFWANSQPLAGGLTHCGYTETTESGPGDFELHDYTTALYGILTPGYDHPQDADGIDTFYFGGGYQYDDAWCRSRCEAHSRCAAYTWYWYHWDWYWEYECVGRSDRWNVLSYDSYAYAGVRDLGGGGQGWWYSTNCGLKKAFVCRKPMDSTDIITPAPTVVVDSYCPSGYFEANTHDSNKCFRIVEIPSDTVGFRWEQAVILCRSGTGMDPDIASIHSMEENAIIASRVQDTGWGYWIGSHWASRHETWVWADNSETRFSNWAPGQPDDVDQCVEMWSAPGPSGTWNNLRCDQQRGYICQTFKDPNNIIPTPPPTTPTTCEAGWTPYWYGCYQKQETPMSWNDAQANCVSKGAALVSIHHDAENSAVYVLGSDQNGNFPIWIGLQRNQESNSYEWVDGWPTYYNNFDTDGTLGEGCVSMKFNSLWNDTACGNLYPSVCKKTDEPTPTLPPFEGGYCQRGWIQWGGHCYWFSEESQEFLDGELECQLRGGSDYEAHLVSVESPQENQFIYSHMLGRGYIYNYWMGLRRVLGTVDQWYWLDGTEYFYNNWAPGEPNNPASELCGVTMVDGTSFPSMWNDVSCDTYDYQYFVCEGSLGPSPTYPVVPTSAPGECPTVEWHKYGADCFLFRPNVLLSWHNAAEDCRLLTGGRGTLASIHDVDENNFVWFWSDYYTRPDNYYEPNMWLGLYKQDWGFPFEWEDDSNTDYFNWAPGEPNDQDGTSKCVRMYISGIGIEMVATWDDYYCGTNNENGYICKTMQGTYSDVEIIDQYGDVAAKGKAKGKKEPRPDLYVNQPQKPLKELDNSPHSLLHGYSQERIEEARRRVMAKLQKESGKGHKKEHHVDKSHHAAKYQADDEEKSDHSNEIIGVVVGCIGAFVAIATVVAIVVVKKRVSVPQATLSFDNPVMEMQESKVVETPEGINHV